jgi:hypothetical protein
MQRQSTRAAGGFHLAFQLFHPALHESLTFPS